MKKKIMGSLILTVLICTVMVSLIACDQTAVFVCENGGTITVKNGSTFDLSGVYAGVLGYDENGMPIDKIWNITDCEYSLENNGRTAKIVVDNKPYYGSVGKDSKNKTYIEFYGHRYTQR